MNTKGHELVYVLEPVGCRTACRAVGENAVGGGFATRRSIASAIDKASYTGELVALKPSLHL